MTINVQTDSKRQVVDITDLVQAELKGEGLVNALAMHTTTALTLADMDPGTDKDYLDAIETMTPKKDWQHHHDPGHFPDHLWSSLVGVSITVPYSNGQLKLGTWQRLVLIELDGPRQRQIELTSLSSNSSK